jgi:hypothetical protein
MFENNAMKIDARNSARPVYRSILAITLLLTIGLSPAASQSAGSTPGCSELDAALKPPAIPALSGCKDPIPQGPFVRAGQVPPAPPNGQLVTGFLDFTTDGKSPAHPLSPTSTTIRVEEEHSIWCLQYSHDPSSGARTLAVKGVRWFHSTMDTVVMNSGPNSKVVTIQTTTGSSAVAPTGQSTLMIANLKDAIGHYHRGLVMSSGVSLPSVVVDEVNEQFVFPRGGGSCQLVSLPGGTQMHPKTAFLEISQEWLWGQWASPYAGKISTTNNYVDYVIPAPPNSRPGTQGTPWLDVNAIWSTQPQ